MTIFNLERLYDITMNVGFYTNNVQNHKTNQYGVARTVSGVSPDESDTVSFRGHFGSEKIKNPTFPFLIHETAFFREEQTDNFVKKYIYKNLLNKDKIKIVSAACSTGEEAITYSMILNDIKDKVKILGFDLSEDAIKQAKSRTYLLQQTKGKSFFAREEMECAGCKDTYLAFDQQRELTRQEKKNKKLFNRFFQPAESKDKVKQSPLVRLRDWLFGGFLKHEKKYYKLKEGKADNCKFIQGNIEDIDKITGSEKADIILFRNAMYHLVVDRIAEIYDNTTKQYNKKIIKRTAQKMKDSLNDNGLVVFGENDANEMRDISIVTDSMKELGFKPLNETSEHIPNVWQKYKD